MREQSQIKAQLVKHLKGGMAFMPLKEMLAEVSFETCTQRPAGLPYSVYEMVYHLYFAQKDILDFCTAESYELPNWPKDYWPQKNEVSKEQWKQLVEIFFKDRDAFEAFLNKDDNNLLDAVKHGDKQNLLRETLLIIEHNAYHTGQLLILLRLLNEHN